MKNQTTEILDLGFDEIDFPETYVRTAAINRPKLTAHCDCRKAVMIFFRLKRFQKVMKRTPMVPTTADSNGLCTHCGHHVLMSAQIIQPPPADGSRRIGRTPKGPVIGINEKTGEQVRFETALAARKAGYGCVYKSLTLGVASKGFRWTRTA